MSLQNIRPQRHPSSRTYPKWSPDGSKLLVEVGRRPTVVDANLKELTEVGPEDTWVTYSDWSPDGERITYSYRGLHADQKEPHWGIYSSKPDGTDVNLMSSTGWRAHWSPDGEKVAYHLVKKEAPIKIAVMDRDGRNETPLAKDHNPGNMSWSSDSKTLFFDSWDGNGGQIFQVDLESGEKSRLMPRSQGSDKSPEMSPDGSKIVFEKFYSNDRRTELRLLDPKTGTDQLFAAPNRSNHDAKWSPDGEHVVFSSNTEEGNFDLYLADADGKSLKQLTNLPGDEFAPAWSPDGKSLAFYHADRESGVAKNVRIIDLAQDD